MNYDLLVKLFVTLAPEVLALIRAGASGKATPEQLETLRKTINELADASDPRWDATVAKAKGAKKG
jgi:hypothetical protein